jgi:peptidoglycan/LPS O-acetylase OafA/YrhL
VAAVLGHVVMSQELIGLPGLMSVFWTLSFEMLFYLLVSALFVLGLHRRVALIAVGLAVVGLLGVRMLPAERFTETPDGKLLAAVVTFVVFGGSIVAYLSGRRVPALVAAVAGLGCLALPMFNGGAGSIPHAVGSWQALFYLAVMFSGTVVHAAHRGRIRLRVAGLALATVFLAGWVANLRHAGLTRDDVRWTGTLLGVVALFSLAYVLRRWPVPGWAAWLGQISYSLYLLHFVVLFPFIAKVSPFLDQAGAVQQAFLFVGYMTVVLAASHLSYTYVERPGQELGKRVGRALDERWRPDVAAGHAHVTTEDDARRHRRRPEIPRQRR